MLFLFSHDPSNPNLSVNQKVLSGISNVSLRCMISCWGTTTEILLLSESGNSSVLSFDHKISKRYN